MGFRQRLFSNLFLRNMAADIFGRSAYSTEPGGFTPYFQYRIGGYRQDDFYLYFSKEPFNLRYRNEVFNKLATYDGLDIPKFLEFHCNACENKNEFLRFLQYELAGRLDAGIREPRRTKLATAKNWVAEKQQELSSLSGQKIRAEIENDIKEIASEKKPNGTTGGDTEMLIDKLAGHIEKIMAETEKKMESMTGSYVTGNIEIGQTGQGDKIIQLLKLLQNVTIKEQGPRRAQLFNKFSDTDIAAMLRLHFTEFRPRTISTLQTKISEAGSILRSKSTKATRLADALEDFFS
jgi:hypothetical protein